MTEDRLRAISPRLSRGRLVSRLGDVLRLARTAVEHLRQNPDSWQDDLDPTVTAADKLAVETSLLVLVTTRVQSLDEELQRVVDDIVALLIPLLRSERHRALLMRVPHTAAALGIGHGILNRLGARDESFDTLIRRALASGHVEMTERLPYRALDLCWTKTLLDDTSPPAAEQLLPHSILAGAPHPIYLSAPDTYALTHSIMYLTDFGARWSLDSIDVRRLSQSVDAALAYHLVSDNIDLLGELLMCSAMLNTTSSPYARLGWRLMWDIWERMGVLPGPTFDATEFGELQGDRATTYALRHIYHTNYVGGILIAMLLQESRKPSQEDLVPEADDLRELSALLRCAVERASAFCACQSQDQQAAFDVSPRDEDSYGLDAIIRRLASLTQTGDSVRPWHRVVDDAPLSSCELQLVLSDALLICAGREYRLAALAEGLLIVSTFDGPVSATFCEALRFLINQQHDSGAIGSHFVVAANRESEQAFLLTRTIAECLRSAELHLTQQLGPTSPTAVAS